VELRIGRNTRSKTTLGKKISYLTQFLFTVNVTPKSLP